MVPRDNSTIDLPWYKFCNFLWMLVLIAKMKNLLILLVFSTYKTCLLYLPPAGILLVCDLCLVQRNVSMTKIREIHNSVPLQLLISLNISLSKPSVFLAMWPLTILNQSKILSPIHKTG